MSNNVLYPRALFKKSATGCIVHHYSYPSAQFVETIRWFNLMKLYMFSKYWCEQASSAAQVCKEINEAKRSAIYLQNEQGMDDAQRAEKRRLGGKSSKSDGLKLRRYTIN